MSISYEGSVKTRDIQVTLFNPIPSVLVIGWYTIHFYDILVHISLIQQHNAYLSYSKSTLKLFKWPCLKKCASQVYLDGFL